MKRTALLSASLVLLPFVTSCAAMFTGTSSDVLITGSPEGGFYVGEDERYPLPYTVDLKKKNKEIAVWHPEFGEMVVPVNRKFSGGYLLMDFLFTPGFGLSGMLIDGSTNAWYSLPALIAVDFTSPPRPEGEPDDAPVEASAAVAAPDA